MSTTIDYTQKCAAFTTNSLIHDALRRALQLVASEGVTAHAACRKLEDDYPDLHVDRLAIALNETLGVSGYAKNLTGTHAND